MKTLMLRYLVVDLESGLVLDDLADLEDALEECEARELDAYEPGGPMPDYGVVDQQRVELVKVERGSGLRVWHWYDAFHGCWRRILAVAA